MKNKKIIVGLLSIILITSIIFNTKIGAKENDQNYGIPYSTFTPGQNDLVKTQTAYVPVGILNYNVTINNPNDLYFKDDLIYIANTSSKNVVVINRKGNLVYTLMNSRFQSPMGVFVDDENNLYVADKEAQTVFMFDNEYKLTRSYEKPTDPLFGNESVYKPEKVVVDKRGNLYITGEGATNGVIQLNKYGNFLGYFAVNQTDFNWKMIFSDIFDLKDTFAKNLPPAPNNVAIDDKGLIYTTTPMQKGAIKKFNLASGQMFFSDIFEEEERAIDICVDAFYNTFVISDKGRFYVLDQNGKLLFLFGGLDYGDQRLGLLGMPISIEVDDVGNLYVADKNYNNIQIFEKTEFSNLVFEANKTYSNGNIEKSKELWTDVYKINSNFLQANDFLGKIALKEKDFSAAMEYAHFSKNKALYSDCFWEVRNKFLINYSYILIIALFGLLLCSFFKVFSKSNKFIKEKTKKIFEFKLIRELFLIFKIIKKPADTYYMIKRKEKASYKSAILLYLILFIFVIISYYATSFIFSSKDLNEINLFMEFVLLLGIIFLWILSNYLISTLFSGEGWFKDIFIGTAYALAPIIIGILPISILTNVLSLNEEFIYTFLKFIMYGYSVILIIIMVKEMHNYKVGETVKNIFLTIFTMIIITALLFVVYLLVSQLFDFIVSVVKELIIRGTS